MAEINDLIDQIDDPDLRQRIKAAVEKMNAQRKFGLVFEDHLPESTPLYDVSIHKGSIVGSKAGYIKENYVVTDIDGDEVKCVNRTTKEEAVLKKDELVCVAQFGEPIYPYLKPVDAVCNAPDSDLWHTLIEADNYHALQLLEYLYAGKVDCIYIDPPYNTGAKDWKYNNDYVDSSDQYRHSKWLSMMKKRLLLAQKLLNPADSVLIVTIDEKEYLHLGCLLEELFPNARMQMISSVINSAGSDKKEYFSRTSEYIYFLMNGESKPESLPLSDEWYGNVKVDKSNPKLYWNQLMRSGSSPLRINHPLTFYPIFVSTNGKSIVRIGDPLPAGVDRHTIKPDEGTKVIWPIRSTGEEGRWQIGKDRLIDAYQKGYVRLGKFSDKGMAITYLAAGEQKKIEEGKYEIIGHREDGSVIEKSNIDDHEFIPGTNWDIPYHNATYFGSQMINKILCSTRFSYPKSLYAVHDTINFFVANKPNAIIVDFFAGSGTTLHAVNLLNAEDGGNRRCILVTNNEVSEAEAKTFTEKGYKPGDEEWERLGIARYVTWERTRCSIEGHDVNGEPLKGNYLGSDIPMADGFKANAAYFKLGFLDKNEVALGRQFRELLPVLWLKAGAAGKCPELDGDEIPDMLIFPENKFAVLIDESAYKTFLERISECTDIKVVYIVTDSENAYKEMIKNLDSIDTYQLYRDYLDNFRINVMR